MLVSIIIINYNTFQLTVGCIRSITKNVRETDYEIIVVDNASSEKDADEFLKIFPQIKLIKSAENLGFAKGNNLGIKHASGNLILLLNSDTYLIEDCITPALEAFKKLESPGAISVKILYPDKRFQRTARKFRSIRNELLDLFRPLLLLLPYKKRARLMLNQYFKGDFDTECDWVSGAFMMFERKLVEELPEQKLDERFFMYAEDQLWCYQFKELGKRNYFLAQPKVIHIANASTDPKKQMSLLKTMMEHELEIMKYRKGKGLYYFVFKIIFTGKELLRYYAKLAMLWIFKFKMR